MKQMTCLILFSLTLISCGGPKPNTIIETYKGGIELKKGHQSLALDKFISAITSDPFLFETNLNLGFGFENQISESKKEMTAEAELQLKNALKFYLAAKKIATKDEHKFIVNFNLGETYGRLKMIPEAIQAYQEALDVVPSSKEVKTNIELLLQSKNGEGGGSGKDQKDGKDGKGNQDQKGQGQGKDDAKDKKDKNQNQSDKKNDSANDKNQDDKSKDKDSKDQNKDQSKDQNQNDQNKDGKQYGNSPKYQPRPFKGDLPESELKKIMNELKQQDQKIRAEYNRKDGKEAPRDKDW